MRVFVLILHSTKDSLLMVVPTLLTPRGILYIQLYPLLHPRLKKSPAPPFMAVLADERTTFTPTWLRVESIL